MDTLHNSPLFSMALYDSAYLRCSICRLRHARIHAQRIGALALVALIGYFGMGQSRSSDAFLRGHGLTPMRSQLGPGSERDADTSLLDLGLRTRARLDG